MKPGRTLSLLTGVALLGAIADFNELTPDAQASLLGSAAETARTTAQSLLSNAAAAYHDLSEKVTGAASAPPPPVRVAAARPAGEDGQGENAPPRRVAARTPEAEQPSGNPLWALPIKQLSSTRERPVFSPSRRPPPPPYVAPVAAPVRPPPPKPAEPPRPQVALLGTIIGATANDGIGVFIEEGSQNIVRLRMGEDHRGWVLRLVKAREVTLVKDRDEAVVLAMPAPGEGPPGLGGAAGAINNAMSIPGAPGAPAAARGRRK